MSVSANAQNSEKLFTLLNEFYQASDEEKRKESRAAIEILLNQEIDPNYASTKFNSNNSPMPLMLYALVVNLPSVAKHIYNMPAFRSKDSLETLIYGPDYIRHNALHLLCMTKTEAINEQQAAFYLLKEFLAPANKDKLNTRGLDGRSPLELATCWLSPNLLEEFYTKFKAVGLGLDTLFSNKEPYWAQVLRNHQAHQLLFPAGLEQGQYTYEQLSQRSDYFSADFFVAILSDVNLVQRGDINVWQDVIKKIALELRQKNPRVPFQVLRNLLASYHKAHEVTLLQCQPVITLLRELFPAFFQDQDPNSDYNKKYSPYRDSIKDELAQLEKELTEEIRVRAKP